MQLQTMIQANPAVPNAVATRLFAYSGVSLFEAARFEIRNSTSLYGQLNQTPVMPLPDNHDSISL